MASAPTLTHRPLEEPIQSITTRYRGTVRKLTPVVLVRRPNAEREPAETRQPREAPLPMDPPPEARLTPDPTEPAEVPRKKAGWPKGKKQSPEAIAKLKATLAAKRKAKEQAVFKGAKIDFVRAHMDKPVPEVIKLAKAQGMTLTANHVYATRSQIKKRQGKKEKQPPARAPKSEARSRVNGAPAPSELTMAQLLDVIAKATAEVQRRLSQLTL